MVLSIIPSSIWKLCYFSWSCLSFHHLYGNFLLVVLSIILIIVKISWFICFIFLSYIKIILKEINLLFRFLLFVTWISILQSAIGYGEKLKQFRENWCITYYQSPWTLNESSILSASEYNPKIYKYADKKKHRKDKRIRTKNIKDHWVYISVNIFLYIFNI